jgi:hypothetical protein
MTHEDLARLKAWFEKYTDSFYSTNEEDNRNIMLKVEHSRCVRDNIVAIARGEGFDESDVMIAEIIGLFHDIGRFPQYAQYRTFRDAESKSHGLLGFKVLSESDMLSSIPPGEKMLILNAVRFHGAYAIPSILNGDSVRYLRLIRDADKADIYRVFIEYYESPPEKRASATAFGVPDSPEYSRKMLNNIMQGRIAAYSDIRTENDFRLMKLSWLYDMNFDTSIRLVVEKGYIEKLMRMMPDRDDINAAMNRLREYIAKRLNPDN